LLALIAGAERILQYCFYIAAQILQAALQQAARIQDIREVSESIANIKLV